MLVSVENIDNLDNNTLALDRSGEEFRTKDASFYQVLHKTTANESLRVAQKTWVQQRFEAWHATVRRYDRRNMSDTTSAFGSTVQ